MNKDMNSFTKDLFSALESMNGEDQNLILKAFIEYIFDGTEPNFDGIKRAVWILGKDYLNQCRNNLLNKEITQKIEKRRVFNKPTVQEIFYYIRENHPDADKKKIMDFSEQFHAFYESKDWMIGKSKMKNWVAAIRTWKETMEKVLYPKMISHNPPAKGTWEYRQMEYLKGVQSIMNDESL